MSDLKQLRIKSLIHHFTQSALHYLTPMYLVADLIIILVFLIGSAVLGFLLGRRSLRGSGEQLRTQLQAQERTLAEVRTKLKRCSAKRTALAQELTEVRTHLSERGLDVANIKPASRVREEANVTATPSAPATGRFARTNRNPNGRSAAAARGEASSRPAAPSKQDETLARIQSRADKLDLDRIGTADARQRDDLKQIEGIGIFTEKKLNALGIHTVAQIANLTEKDQLRVNQLIELSPGRVVRDAWVEQAQKLTMDS